MWDVYIIRTISGRLYTGITRDMKRRFQEHASGRHGARYFRFSAPEKVLWTEKHPDRSSATKRERQIKSMSKAQKLSLISGGKKR